MNKNKAVLTIESRSQNESLARVAVTAFIAPLDPTLEVASDVKTAVSEAVTNAIIHGYEGDEKGDEAGEIKIAMSLTDGELLIEVSDQGVGIADVEQAMEPLFTTKPELERSGMGFSVMESFTDSINVLSTLGSGTTVTMTKKIL